MSEDLNNILGIVASLIAILSPLISVILNKKSESQNNGINITTINNYNYYKNSSVKKNDSEITDYIIQNITKNHKELIGYSEIMLLLALVFTLSNFIIVVLDYNDLFFVADYISYIIHYGKYGVVSYLVSFLITFLGFFFISYFLLAYYYDFRLRGDLQIFNYLHNRPVLEKFQRILIKECKFSNFSIYPVQTIARLIENSDIKAKNRRRTKSPHDSLRIFWENNLVVWAFLSLLVIHFTFIIVYKEVPKQVVYPTINVD